MSKTTNKRGELKVVPNTEVLEEKQALEHVERKDFLRLIYQELRKLNKHMEDMRGERISVRDLDNEEDI